MFLFEKDRPPQARTWRVVMLDIFANDYSGIMKTTRDFLEEWQERDIIRNYWNVNAAGLFETPSTLAKKRFVEHFFKKYLDKSLQNFLRTRKKGSLLYYVGEVEKNVNFTGTIQVNDSFEIGGDVRIFENKGKVFLKTSLTEHSLEFSRIFMQEQQIKWISSKYWNRLSLFSRFEYDWSQNLWLLVFDQDLGNNLVLRFSSAQSLKSAPWNYEADKVISLHFTPSML